MFKEKSNQLIEDLKKILTADNTEAVTKMCDLVREMESEHTTLEAENTKLKDKIVDVVKSSMFVEKPQENIIEKEKTLDELLLEEINNASK